MDRDVLRGIVVKEIKSYDISKNTSRTTYKIESRSYPQYSPYRSHTGPGHNQRRYRHEYEVVIQMDELSLDTDRFKIRTGSDAKWDFSDKGKSKKDRRGRIKEGTNIKRGLNGDHFFRLSYIRKEAGILYGRNFANGPPVHTNPNSIQFLTKHELRVLEQLINRGLFNSCYY